VSESKNVPFYANDAGDRHGMLAVYRSVISYFLGKEPSWEELEALVGTQPTQPIWTFKALTHMITDYHMSVKMVEPFNYKKFASEGTDYLYDLYDNEEQKLYLSNTNIREVKPLLTKFIAAVRPVCRRATLQDIDEMLSEGRLVYVAINGKTLNGEDGFSKHAILITDIDGSDYIAHDPGLPAQQNRRISRDDLWTAMGGDTNMSEVTGFKNRVAGLRLDQYVIQHQSTLSRSFAVRLIDEGKVLVNGKQSKAGFKLRDSDVITIDFDEANQPKLPDINLPVLYEDDDCVVINKPAGVLTHSRGTFNDEGTVASWLRARINKAFVDKTGPHPSVGRAGIVHRLDRATSGVMICAKTPEALASLQKQFHDRLSKKTYTAIVQGAMNIDEAVIDMAIERNPKAPATFRVGANGKSAITRYKVTTTSKKFSMLELQPQTGRTHQLRVHLVQQGHPIVGDKLYNGKSASRLYLHAHKLEITLPKSAENETTLFEAPLPLEFNEFMQTDGASDR
jgi:23S rRNA pseudouridine1911/1915/1917 synthase